MKEEDINTKINFGGSTFKKYFFNTSWLFFEKVLRLGINLVVGVYVVRYLGPEQNGLLAFAISVVAILTAFSSLGLGNILVREIINRPDDTSELLGTSFYSKLIFSIFLFIVVGVFYIAQDNLQNLLLVIIAGSIIFRSLDVVEYLYQSKVLAKYPVTVKFISILVADGSKVILIIYNAPLVYFAAAYLSEFVIMALGYFIILEWQKNHISKWIFRFETAKRLLKDSWPLMFSTVAVVIYTRIDRVILKYLMTDSDVGIYDAAVKLCEGWYFIPMIITSSLFPAIVTAKNMNQKLYESRLQKLYDMLAWIAILIAVPITVFSSDIIRILYGEKFIAAAPVLTIYIWAGVPVFLGVANSQYLIAENFTKISFVRTNVGMVVNILLNLWLIPIWGLIGSAYATLISYTLATFFILFIPKTFKQALYMCKSLMFVNLIKKIIYKYA